MSDNEIQEPDNSTVDDWFGQQVDRDAEVADEAIAQADGDLDEAEKKYEQRATGQRTYEQSHPRPS